MGKGIEQAALIGCADANAAVVDLESQNRVVVIFVGLRENSDHDLAGRGEFDRVANQIGKHLAKSARVSSYPRRRPDFDQVAELQAFGVGALGHELEYVLDHRAKLKIDVLHLQLAGLDFGKIQYVVDD